jgi:WD40 repeat protein
LTSYDQSSSYSLSQCLISGGADAKIIVWDTATGQRLHTLRDKTETMMAIQNLTLDIEATTGNQITVVSSSSDPHIRRWHISLESASQILEINDALNFGKDVPARATILEHETSVYKVLFAGEDQSYDLWTASADGTAKCLSRAKNWSTEETYEHGDYVRAVAVTSDWVITAGRDENVKVWDKATGKLWHVYEGHYEEITGLVVLEGEKKVVSVSIDGTVRIWGLTKDDLAKAQKEKDDAANGVLKEEKVRPKTGLLTAEEEAELADLMGSDEE